MSFTTSATSSRPVISSADVRDTLKLATLGYSILSFYRVHFLPVSKAVLHNLSVTAANKVGGLATTKNVKPPAVPRVSAKPPLSTSDGGAEDCSPNHNTSSDSHLSGVTPFLSADNNLAPPCDCEMSESGDSYHTCCSSDNADATSPLSRTKSFKRPNSLRGGIKRKRSLVTVISSGLTQEVVLMDISGNLLDTPVKRKDDRPSPGVTSPLKGVLKVRSEEDKPMFSTPISTQSRRKELPVVKTTRFELPCSTNIGATGDEALENPVFSPITTPHTPFRTPKSLRRGKKASDHRILGTPDYLAPELLLQQDHGTNYIQVELNRNYIQVKLNMNYIQVKLNRNYIQVKLNMNYIQVKLNRNYIQVKLNRNYIQVKLNRNYNQVKLNRSYIQVELNRNYIQVKLNRNNIQVELNRNYIQVELNRNYIQERLNRNYIQFMTGIPPFNDETPQAVFNNILTRDIPWPEGEDGLSRGAQAAIDALLTLDPKARPDAKDVQGMPLFDGIDWSSSPKYTAAICPRANRQHGHGIFPGQETEGSLHVGSSRALALCQLFFSNISSDSGSSISPVPTESLAHKDILSSGHEVSYPCVHPWILSLAAADAPAHDTHLSPLTGVNHQWSSAVPLSTQTTLHKTTSDAVTEEDDNPLAGFYGQPWSAWTDFTGNVTPSRDEYQEPDICPEPDTTKLDIKDMYLYGLCPEAEPFYAVICEICDASVKPQGLKNHMELWHDVKLDEPLPPVESFGKGFNRRDYISKTCKVINSTNSTIKIKKPLQTKLDKSFVNKEQLEQTLFHSKEKTVFVSKPDKCLPLPSSAEEKTRSAPIVSKLSSPFSILQPIVALTPLPSTTEGVTVVTSKVNDTAQNPVHLDSKSSRHSSTLPPKKSSKPRRRHLPKEQKFNPDKQCGVWSEKSQKQCTRSLTCSHHSLSQQRFVTGRSKSFDQLLADHKAAKKASLKQIDSSYIANTQVTALKKKSNILPSVKVSQVIQSDSSAPNQPVPVPVSSNNSILSKPAVFISVNLALSPTPNLELQNPDSSQEKRATKTIPLAKFPPNSSLSSQPPDDYFTKRKSLFEGVTWSNTHPRPLAVCTFSARKVGSLFSSSRSLAVVRKAMKATVSAKFNWRATS
uniref:SCA7 domain-containing protein n=1 Tax=Timema shepardi TaxID=629360 RepID=A0A7R9G3X3_TIMSH|nr:unnamed protein product [Timema shepardi]